ncbi:MAG: FeoA family protein [Candidatus Margulisiibacteriota bacterium]
MFAKEVIALTKMDTGESGVVVDVLGGRGAFRRLEALGIRIGKKIIIKSRGLLWGPVTVQVGTTQIGVGHGMASKVMVEVKR